MSSSTTPANAAEPRYDLVVIGAGINGAAIAREAALHGIRTLLVERGDLCCGTSGASSRLIHGGLRYLEHGELGLVYESLAERERLLAHAPHLVAPLALHIPLYRRSRRKRWQVATGLTLYDWLSRGKSLPGHRLLKAAELAASLPGIETRELVGGAVYFDAQAAFPERLVVENVRDAVENGATLMTYTEVTRIRVVDGRATGIEWRAAGAPAGRDSTDERGAAGEHGTIGAPVIVNAAGPWVDAVLGDIAHTRLLGGTKGSHLIVPEWPGAPRGGVYVEAASDGRPFFILPWNGLTLIGTTDERFAGDADDAAITPQEIDYLASETQRVFPAARGLAERMCYTHCGVRPLPFTRRGAAGAITRRHLVRRHRSARGVYSVVGGKLTTHRALAEDVLAYVGEILPLERVRPSRSRPLPGALPAAQRDEILADVGAVLGAAQARRLWSVYGAAAGEVAKLARQRELADELEPGTRMLVAEAVYALEHEWARTLVDVLQRRTMAGLAADFGLRAAAACAQRLGALGLWSRDRAAAELEAYRAHARRHRARDER